MRLLLQVLQAHYTAEIDIVAAEGDLGALLAAEKVEPEILMLGVGMPHLISAGLIGELRARWPAARVIVLSSLNLEAYRAQALSAGADAVITKEQIGADLLPTIQGLTEMPGCE